MNLRALTRGLNALVGADDDVGFVELTRRSGINPARDFRQANMAGADLRGQDLRGFDFRHARFDGARIHGARFHPPLSLRQRLSADTKGRGVAVCVGTQLEQAFNEIRLALEPSILAPPLLNQGLRRVGDKREQHYEAGGLFVSDGQPTVSRTVGKPFRDTVSLLKSSKVAIILFQPTTDFDFDTLAVVQRRIEAVGRPHLTFAFPSFMEGDGGRRLFEVRARTVFTRPQDTFIFEQGSGRPAELRAAQDANNRNLSHLVQWLRLLDDVRFVRRTRKASRRAEREVIPTFASGVKGVKGSLVNALRAHVDQRQSVVWANTAERKHLFLSESLAASTDLDAVAKFLGAWNRPVSISVFADGVGPADRYFLVSAPESSSVWSLTGR